MKVSAVNRFRSRCLLRVSLLLLCCLGSLFLFGCENDQQQILINEVVSSNKLSYVDEALGSPDWIELHNVSASAINLQGYILTDKEDSYDLNNMLPDVSIPAGGFLVIPAKSGVNSDTFCLPFGLSKGGDTVCLLNPSGRLLEKLIIPQLPKDVSYARRSDGSFGYSILPTPGNENTGEISDTCPEIEESAEESSMEHKIPDEAPEIVRLCLNEIVSNDLKDGACNGNDWIELYNPNDMEISLEGFFLSDRIENPDKAPLPPLTVSPNGYALIPCGPEEGSAAIGIASTGETIYLFDAYERPVDSVPVPTLLEGQSWARNRNGIFGYCGIPTPNAENNDIDIGIEAVIAADSSESLRISEVLFRNTYSIIDSYGDHSDYVELYNSGNTVVSLKEYCLSDEFSNPLKWRCPDLSLEPGTYLLIFLSGQESVNGELHAPFSVSSLDDGLQLYHVSRRMYQRVPWSDAVPKNTSMGLDSSGNVLYFKYPTPGVPNSAAITDVSQLCAYPLDDIHISEVSSCGSEGEWIELRNGSAKTVDLSNWQLSDSLDPQNRCPLTGSISPNGYISFSPDSFRIRATGETLYLFDDAGLVRDVFRTGDLTEGITSGRSEDSKLARVFFAHATRDVANEPVFFVSRAATPLFDDQSLYHTEPFSAEIHCADPNAVIRYTTDGSEPTESSPIYTAPIPISASVTLRAISTKDHSLPSKISSVTYLFSSPHTLPVVCISCSPNAFKAFTQIKTQGRYPHTDAQIAFYEADGTLGTMFMADINPRGNQSIKYPQKSLSLHLRTRLGQSSVNYPFWGNGSALDYESLILRNGSQDYSKARLRDSFALCAVEKLNLDSARTRPVVVYVNGSYYGIMDFNEGMNQDYLVTHYLVDPASIDHVSTNETVRYGSNQDFLRVRRFARGWKLADPDAFAQFSKWVDTEYIIDYLIAQTFFCNYDIKNQSYWATHDYHVRWRPVFYDIDRCFTDGTSQYNLFTKYFSRKGVVYDSSAGRVANMDLYAALRDNPDWCDRFLHRYAQLLCTDFSVERLQALLDQLADALRPEMAQHIALFHTPSSLSEWESSVASMRKEIIKRYDSIQEQICKEFKLSSSEWDAFMQEAKNNAASDP